MKRTWEDTDLATPELVKTLVKRIPPLEPVDIMGRDERSITEIKTVDREAREATLQYCGDIITGTHKIMHDAEIMVSYFYYGYIACSHQRKEKKST